MAEAQDQPRPIEAYHGGIDAEEVARYGWTAEQVVDFSSNILPHGPSPSVCAAVRQAAIDRYPDRECTELRAAIAQQHSIHQDRILVGNGSSELIHAIALAMLQPDDETLILGPTFSEYQRAAELAAATVRECRARADTGFHVPTGEIDEWLQQRNPKVAFLCNPNNPTGQRIERQTLLRWIERHRRTTFVVDESYLEFTGRADSLLPCDRPNLIVLRSMTKAYAMAGIRLGYAAASPEVVSRLRTRRVPWNVSAPAQVAGIAAIGDQAYYESCLRELHLAKRRFVDDLAGRGICVVSSDANFFLIQVRNACAVRHQLMTEGMLVRHCGSFGLANYLRVSVRMPNENLRLADSLARWTAGNQL